MTTLAPDPRDDRPPRAGARVHGRARLSERAGARRARTTPPRSCSARCRRRSKEAGPLGAVHRPGGGRHRRGLHAVRLPERDHRPHRRGRRAIFGCQAPDTGNAEILHMFGTDEQKERWLQPLVAGEIRSFFSMTEPEVSGLRPDRAADARRARRRRVGDQRAQVVLVLGRGRGVRDRDGRDRPGRAAAPADEPDHRPDATRPASSSIRADPGHGPHRPRLDDALRGALHGRPRAARRTSSASRATASGSRRSGSARGGSITCMRWLGQMQRAFELMCSLRARAPGRRRAARREADRPELDRRLRRRDPGLPAADALTPRARSTRATRRGSRSR